MWEAIQEGIGLGLTLAIMIGPVFFTLVNITLQNGARTAIIFDTGIITSDMLLMIATFAGIDTITRSATVQQYIGYTGSIFLIITGIKMLFTRRVSYGKPFADFSKKEKWRLFYKGLLINTLNPFTFIFWIGVAAFFTAKKSLNYSSIFGFYGAILSTILVTDLGKIYFSRKLSAWLNQKVLNIFTKISGLILIVFAIRLWYFSYHLA